MRIIGNSIQTVTLSVLIVLSTSVVHAQLGFAEQSLRQNNIESSEFIHIPGPNPILRPGPTGAWDDENIEAGDAFEDLGTYYLYYHSMSSHSDFEYQYQIGVATADRPLGPFIKQSKDHPILSVGKKESWDDGAIACPVILKESDDKYYMWYWGMDDDPPFEFEGVGLAIASHPLGPWEKYEGNPVLKDVGYVGGVVKTDGKYYIYSAHTSSIPGYKGDYGPLVMAVADQPEGPYVKYEGNPIIEKGNSGDWDDGGISEAGVHYHNGMFHMFYGGTKIAGPRLESIGYAYSFDGFDWYKYGRNPVAERQSNPNAAAFAEVHAIFELPYIYLYHTIRPEKYEGKDPMDVEDLGIQVLVTQKPFSVDMPALVLDKLAPGASSILDDAPPICLGNISRLSLTAECRYTDRASRPVRIHVRSSYDGLTYDTADLYTLDNELEPGHLSRKTFQLDSGVRFIKVIVENLDLEESISNVKIVTTLGG